MNEWLKAEIRRALAHVKLSPEEWSVKAELGKTYVKDILSGKSGRPTADRLRKLAVAGGFKPTAFVEPAADEGMLPFSLPVVEPPSIRTPPPPPPEKIDVWASAEGGDHGAMLITSDPIDSIPRPAGMARDAFAVFLLGDSMSPAYEQGDQLYIDPNKPIRPGNDCLFIRETEDGSRYALAKRLMRPTADKWHVRQFMPAKDFTLSRGVWSRAWLIAGKWNR